jgi:cytochrome c-type biogenesis protein
MTLTVTIAFLAGLVSFLSPCVLPLVPAYIGYMSGRVSNTTRAATAGGPTLVTAHTSLLVRLNAVTHGIAFVIGFTLIFVVIGLATTAFIRQVGGSNVALLRDILARAGGALVIFFGLHFMGVVAWALSRLLARPALHTLWLSLASAIAGSMLLLWALVDPLFGIPAAVLFVLWLVLSGAFSQPASFWQSTLARLQTALYSDTRRHMTAGRTGYGSSLMMGIVFAAGWTPCIGPIYGSILTLAANGGDVTQAGSMMIAYSLGLGVPFLLAAVLMDGAQGLLRRLQRSVRTIELASGALLVFVGILVASGQLAQLSETFAVQYSDLSYRLETCAARLSEGDIMLGEFFACANETDAAA